MCFGILGKSMIGFKSKVDIRFRSSSDHMIPRFRVRKHHSGK